MKVCVWLDPNLQLALKRFSFNFLAFSYLLKYSSALKKCGRERKAGDLPLHWVTFWEKNIYLLELTPAHLYSCWQVVLVARVFVANSSVGKDVVVQLELGHCHP